MCKLVYLSFPGHSNGAGVLPDSLSGSVGQNEKVKFLTTLSPTETPLDTFSWEFQPDAGQSTFIVTVSTADNIPTPEYNGRISWNQFTASLELFNLTLNDSGQYTVTVLQTGAHPQTGGCDLLMYGE